MQRHVELLRTGLPEELVTPLWTTRGKRSYYVTNPAAAAALALQGDAYVCVSFLRKDVAEKLGPHKRVCAGNAAGLTGLTIDLDVIGTPDGKGGVKKAGAANIDEAIAAAHLLAEPTLVILSGGGVQAWWLFEKPLIFSSSEERAGEARV